MTLKISQHHQFGNPDLPSTPTDRRRFLIAGLGAAAAMALPAAPALALPVRQLSFRNLHTGECLTANYWAGGHHLAGPCRRIDHLLRDFRTGEVKMMSRHLLDVLFALKQRLGTEAPFEVISGYRSPKTNARLFKAGHGVARHSLHMRGLAIDIRVPDVALKRLRREAVSLKAGGVGYYPRSDFIHVDVGRVRYW